MSSQLHVIAVVKAKDGQRDLVREALMSLLAPTRAEAGCKEYLLHEDIEDKNTFIFYETWESAEALAAHMQSAHFLEVAERTKDAAELTIHQATMCA